eukprot:4803641-Lingulodinium_polyedra.AAC.1
MMNLSRKRAVGARARTTMAMICLRCTMLPASPRTMKSNLALRWGVRTLEVDDTGCGASEDSPGSALAPARLQKDSGAPSLMQCLAFG